jgi:hypothetical protein
MSSGTWTTTNGGAKVTISAGGVGALIVAGYVLTHPHQASEAAGGMVTILAITFGALVVLAGLVVFLKLRGRSRNTAGDRDGKALPAGIRWQANPNAIPAPERPAIAAAPIVNVNIGADLLAGLMEAARQQQPAPVYVQSETVQQEIPR